MIVKVEKNEQPQGVEKESECEVIHFEPKPVFQMGKTGGSPEEEAIVYEMFLQAMEPVHSLNRQRA
jgi:hypothetical protein